MSGVIRNRLRRSLFLRFRCCRDYERIINRYVFKMSRPIDLSKLENVNEFVERFDTCLFDCDGEA